MSWTAAACLLTVASLGTARDEGLRTYTERCAVCHGRVMEGTEEGPPLTGPRFEEAWRGQSASLRDKIRRSMPQDRPGSLSKSEARALACALLWRAPVLP